MGQGIWWLSAVIMVMVAAPAGAQGSVDLLLRYPPQEVVVVGNGTDATSYNAYLVEAAPGDPMTLAMLVKVRGSNTMADAVNVTISAALTANGTETWLADAVVAIPAGDDGPFPAALSWVLPDVGAGTHELAVTMQAGAFDANPANNDPERIPLRVGEPVQSAPAKAFQPRHFAGPAVMAVLIALPLSLRSPAMRQRWTSAAGRADAAVARLSAQWIHTPLERRRSVVQAASAGVLVAAGIALVLGEGGLAFTPKGFLEATLLAVIVAGSAALVWLVGWLRAHRTGEAPWRKWLRLAAMMLITGLFWQQLAAANSLFRWPEFTALAPFLVIGLSVGAVYALIAVGYTMVYGVLKFINFAHGEIFMWGAYAAWFLAADQAWLAFPVAIIGAVVFTGALGAGVERLAYRPLRGKGRLVPLITAIAVSIALSSTAQFLFGPEKQSFSGSGGTLGGSSLHEWLNHDYQWLGASIDNLSLATMATSVALMAGLHLFVKRSRTGQAMRAVADDMETARIIGINVDRVIVTTFVIGSMLAAVAGIAFGLRFSIGPTMGLLMGIKAFTAAVVGGIGNVYGAFLGGFMIGLAENVGGQFIDSRFQNVISFIMLILFLLLRPQGIFPGPGVNRK